MKLKAYVIKDNLSGFMTPEFKLSDAVALRDFSYLVNEEKGLLHSKAEDYSLYCIGEYDTDKGVFKPMDKKIVAEAISLLRKD